mgnify:CR=1 FL=1
MAELTRVILQARTDSTRLPGKALLPVAGMPTVVLALLRAANTGLDVRLATSNRAVDDRLAETVADAGIPVFRGDAENVRARYLACCADLPDEAIVVRLTGDNLLPNGSLIDEVIEEFTIGQRTYLSSDMCWRSPPYGLSVEVFNLGALRQLAGCIDDSFEREHVTPALRREYGSSPEPKPRFTPPESAIRCTLDTFDDWRLMDRCFEGVADPVRIDWELLLERMVAQPDAPVPMHAGPGLIVGTAQLGAPYGSVVATQPPARDEAVHMLRTAIASRVTGLDTARAYPNAERIVGQALKDGYASQVKVITKLSPLAELSEAATQIEAGRAAENSVLRSLRELGSDVTPDLLLHRASHLHQWDGAVWRRLLDLQAEGLIDRLGVSVQSPDEAEMSLKEPAVQFLQLACNLLDWRWSQSGLAERFGASKSIEIHVRSVYLQGTLLREPSAWPSIEGLCPERLYRFMQDAVVDYRRSSIADLCVAWARAQDWIDAVVIGAESLQQIRENINLFSLPPLSHDEAKELGRSVPTVPEKLLDPARWPGSSG